ncbi:MAG: hypothetical protein OQK94_08155 [Gammaproteobacteria bacterium]|nr:hypothetical protein [Gammaproteobacteria bacterium]MCW8841000.1 hypothetical protein [Gammaproteobacteria bacterium]MCW8957549.1 hypothetical protein [Gammaproteobacteria bacterium]MCW8972812.1 hypothetical protein [Gammaproteobacteria bacterium]MCW8992115.1 hypothetical protein [Gammaproteobacteria bacterium]
MPVLPSGRYVGIMSERARLHASRLKLRVSESTPHHQLYPLVDILVERGEGDAHSGNSYGFSGYTLADLKWINQWEDRDRHYFLEWIREDSQVRTIELARRRLLAEKAIPRAQLFDYPQRLYSLFRMRLQALPLQRARVEQWRRTLLNMKRDGVRQEEIAWAGVLEFLARKPADLTLEKEVVLGAIDFSAIRPGLSNELQCDNGCRLSFKETAQRMPAYQLQQAGYVVNDDDVGVVRLCSSHNYRIGRIWPHGRSLVAAAAKHWFALSPYGQAIIGKDRSGQDLFSTQQEAELAANRHALRSHRLRCDLTYSTRYEYMTLSGGRDYREWLVTLPDYHRSHFNGHFYERNILLHIRSKIRRSGCGKMVLFIEELQSDWHQAAARSRQRVGVPPAPFRKEWASLALKLMLHHVVEEGLDGIAWADATVHALRYDRSMTPLQRLYDEEIPRFLERLASPWGCRVEHGEFATRQPWLHAERRKDAWRVQGGAGKFSTRPRYNKEQAVTVIERHSKAVTLSLPMLILPQAMRDHIYEQGLPLFGERLN